MNISKVPRVVQAQKKYDKAISEQQTQGTDLGFSLTPGIKATYDMFGWIYQEVAGIRLEVSRLGMLVRINNSNSPSFLNMYHSHIYSFLIPVSVIIDSARWNAIENLWLSSKGEIDEFLNRKKNIPNLKIPFSLIRKLDNLHRVALLLAQRAGLGIRTDSDTDIEKAIENAVTGG